MATAAILVVALSPAIGHARPPTSDLDRRIATASERLEVLVERHNAVRSDLHATRVRLAATAARIERLAAGIEAARARVNEIVAWSYKAGPIVPAVALLTAESPDSLVRRLTTLDTLARGQAYHVRTLAESSRWLDRDRLSLRGLAETQAAQEAELSRLVTRVTRDLAGLRDLRRQVGTASRSGARTGSRATPAPPPPSTPPPPPPTDPPGPPSPPPPPPPPPPPDDDARRVVGYAYAQLGKPYRFGAAGPWAFDCSGLTMAAWRAAGVALPHNAARQYRAVPHVSRAQLRPGDLVFYYGDIHHVAIYVGRGRVIHAPNPDDRVSVSPLDLAPVHGFGRPG